jgi:hypothetical protein
VPGLPPVLGRWEAAAPDRAKVQLIRRFLDSRDAGYVDQVTTWC